MMSDTTHYRTFGSCGIRIPNPFCLVIFGASGDLTRRKIIPAAYRLFKNRLLPDDFCIMGTGRTGMSEGEFRSLMKEAVSTALPDEFQESNWEEFARRLFYCALHYDDILSYRSLSDKMVPREQEFRTSGNRIFYLATPPELGETVVENLGGAGLSQENAGYTHIVIEKPFGHDLESSRRLNAVLKKAFTERQIYRMDHYLAKETVQNILVFRFANAIFEPLWNSKYIDHVQITVSETLGVEHRGGYYDGAGVIRDMFQNHIFQLLALTAMEPPTAFDSENIRDEKMKVFRSLRPFPLDHINTLAVIGQYGKGRVGGTEVPAYCEEDGIPSGSLTPTYAALKIFVDNWRWNGVPFYLRSGKRLEKTKAEISIHYRPVPHLMFNPAMNEEIEPNVLTLRVQPDEGISLAIQAKVPGSRICLDSVDMKFSYEKVFLLEAYERVLLDCMQGDQMLFVREDAVDQAWVILTPLIQRLESEARPGHFPNYSSGSSGPEEARFLIERDGRKWRTL